MATTPPPPGQVLAKKLSKDKLKGLRSMFKQLDIDGNGTLSVEEFTKGTAGQLGEEDVKVGGAVGGGVTGCCTGWLEGISWGRHDLMTVSMRRRAHTWVTQTIPGSVC